MALSRVKTINDLIIEPMTFERLKGITNLPNFKYRLKEEIRLTNIAEKKNSEQK